MIACVNGYAAPRAAPHWKVAPVLDLLQGAPAVDLDPRIAAAGPDVVLVKSAPSIFATPAAAILTKERVDTVIVTAASPPAACAPA